MSFTELVPLEPSEVELENDPFKLSLYSFLQGKVFDRCVISGGVTVQGRCTRGLLDTYVKNVMRRSHVITISQTLAAVPFSYTLSVVAHECCHLCIFDHSRAFKKLLHLICPFETFVDVRWLELKPLVSVSPIRQRAGKTDVVRVGRELLSGSKS